MRRVTPLFVVGGALALGACGSGPEEPAGEPVPIVAVTELASFSAGGLLSVLVDDYRGCPTAFAATAVETPDEVRLTARAFRGTEHACAEPPTVALKASIGARQIVDVVSGLTADSVTGKALVDPCVGQQPCAWAGEERRKGRTFGFGTSGRNMRVFVSDPE